jgi:tight adherence protein C
MFDVLSSVPIHYLVAGVGAACGLVLFVVLGQLEERATVRATLRQLDDYEIDNGRDKELLVPLAERVLKPIIGRLNRFGHRFNPPDYAEGVRRKFAAAGIYSSDAVERHLAIRVVGLAAIPVFLLVMFVWNPFNITGILRLGVVGLFTMVAFLGPDSQLNKKVEARRKELRNALPDTLDLLVISVEAGLGFEQALDRVIDNVPGALSVGFATVLGETRAGAGRSDALRSMDQRCNVPEIRSFVLAMIQADTFGVSIGRVLRSQADEMRVKRRQRAQEQAMKAPVKMLLPMVFCIFPALFVVVLGPAIINITQNF